MNRPSRHPPTRIGAYKIVRFIGAGGAGEVYAARDEALERDVAIKVLKGEVAQDKTRRDRFMREGKMMARIRSPHVAAIYAVGEQDGLPFLVMELLQGDDLENRLRKSGAMSVREALTAARQACLGLDAAAHLDVIHRDVKPANMIFTSSGVKLTDFGLARPQDGSAQVTTEGLVTGTPAFLAPERAMGKADNLCSDIYSLGATLYTLLAGEPPFVRDTPIEVITAHLKEEAANIEEVAESVDAQVGRLVRKMMRKEPEHRYQTYAEVISGIDLCLMEQQGHDAITPVNDPFGALDPAGMSAAVAPTGVMGSLKQMSVNDITQMLEMGRKTATIEVAPTGLASAELGILEGMVVFATMGELAGEEAFYSLCSLQEGSFRIRYGRAPSEKNIEVPTQFLMLEAMRRIDEGSTQRPVSQVSSDASVEHTDTASMKPAFAEHTSPANLIAEQPATSTPSAMLSDHAADAPSTPSSRGRDEMGVLHGSSLPADTTPGEEEGRERRETSVAVPDGAVSEQTASAPSEQPPVGEFDDRTEVMPASALDSDHEDESVHEPRLPDTSEFQDVTAPIRVLSSALDHTEASKVVGHAPSATDPLRAPASFFNTFIAAREGLRARLSSGPSFVADDLARVMSWFKQRPTWVQGLLIFCSVILLLLVAVASFGGRGAPSLERIDQGEAAAVLAELNSVSPIERTPVQNLLRAHALSALNRSEEALAVMHQAVAEGAEDDRALQFLIQQLSQDAAGVAIDILIRWQGKEVTAQLAAQTQSGRYQTRKHAVTALHERGEGDVYDQFEVALMNLKDAPDCRERKKVLAHIKSVGHQLKDTQRIRAREAVQAAARRAGNECMRPLFRKMLPDPYR